MAGRGRRPGQADRHPGRVRIISARLPPAGRSGQPVPGPEKHHLTWVYAIQGIPRQRKHRFKLVPKCIFLDIYRHFQI